MPDEQSLPDIWVRAHPFGSADVKDVHGEYFAADTEFYDEMLPAIPVNYYHSRTPEGKPVDAPTPIGIAAERQYKNPLTGEADGRWDKIKFFDNVSDDIKTRIQKAIDTGTLRASTSTVPDFHHVSPKDGKISHWLAGSLTVFDADGARQPANPRAIGIAQMKSLFKAANLEFPETLMKSGGNPNHDDEGKFSSGGGSGGNASNHAAMSTADLRDMHDELHNSTDKQVSHHESTQTVPSGEQSKRIFDKIDAMHAIANELSKRSDGGGRGKKEKTEALHLRAAKVNTGKFSKAAHLERADYMATNWQQNVRTAFYNFMKAISAKPNKQGDDDGEREGDDEKNAVWKEFIDDDDETDDEEKDEKETTNMADKATDKPNDKQDKQDNGGDELRIEWEKRENKMKADLATMRRELDAKDLDTWFSRQVEAGKAMPPEHNKILTFALTCKAQDDQYHPTMKFADGKESNMLDTFKEIVEARIAFGTFDEKQLNEMKANLLGGERKPDEVSAERHAELLAATDMGATILAEKNGKK